MSSDITIIKGNFSTELPLPLAPGIRAGFPSPAQDYLHDTLDFNNDMIHHKEATFYARVDGDSMRDAGILPGDIAVHPANPSYKTIRIDNPDQFRVWGVIIWTIHNWRNY